MTNVFVVGAHGHVGRLLVPKLAKAGYHVIASVRKKAYFDELTPLENVEPVLFDLNANPEEIASVFEATHAEVIVFSAGSGGSTGDDQTLAIDLDGAIKTMISARQAHVHRYVMVSAAGSDDRSFWPNSGLNGYYIAKHYADDYLRSSDLDYTILRPTALTDDEEANAIKVEPNSLADTSIARSDVANAVVSVIGNDKTIKKVYQFTEGNTPIQDAF